MTNLRAVLIGDADDGRRAIVEEAVGESPAYDSPLVATTAESTAEVAETAQPALIVLGFPLPSMQPLEMLPLIRRLAPASQVICWSGPLTASLLPDDAAVALLPADATVAEVRQVLDEHASGNPSPDQSAQSIFLGMPLPPKRPWRGRRS